MVILTILCTHRLHFKNHAVPLYLIKLIKSATPNLFRPKVVKFNFMHIVYIYLGKIFYCNYNLEKKNNLIVE